MRQATTQDRYPHLFRAKIEGSISAAEFDLLLSNQGLLQDAESICKMYFYFQAYGYSDNLAMDLFESQYNAKNWDQIGKILSYLMKRKIVSEKIDANVFEAILMDACTPPEILFKDTILNRGVRFVNKNPVLALYFQEYPGMIIQGVRSAYGENGPICEDLLSLIASLCKEIQVEVARNKVPQKSQLELLQFFMDRVLFLGEPRDKTLPELLSETGSWTKIVGRWAIAFMDKMFDSDRDSARARCSENLLTIAVGNPRTFPSNISRQLLDLWNSELFEHKQIKFVIAIEWWIRKLEAHFHRTPTPLLLDIIREST